MSTLPFTEQQCFFVAILAFIVVGFQRGWRRELISLVFILLAVFLVNPQSGKSFGQFLSRLPGVIAYLLGTGSQQPAPTPSTTSFLGPAGPLLFFALLVALGYYIGNKAFPKPSTPQDRFIGVVPAVVSGSFVLAYLSSFVPKSGGQSLFAVTVQTPDPSNYIPVIFVIAIVSVVIALVVARAKKTPAKK